MQVFTLTMLIIIISIALFIAMPKKKRKDEDILTPDHNFAGYRIYWKHQKCFYCKKKYQGKDKTKEVKRLGTNVIWYYHKDCLKEVLQRPEWHEKYLRLALDIREELTLREEEREKYQVSMRKLIDEAKAVYKREYEDNDNNINTDSNIEEDKPDNFIIVYHHFWMKHKSWEVETIRANSKEDAEIVAKARTKDKIKEFNDCESLVLSK